MTIYKISVNVNKYQWVMPIDVSDETFDLLTFNGSSKGGNWNCPPFFVNNPLKEKSNFYSLDTCGAFVCDKLAAEFFYQFFTFGCELLPIKLEDGTELFIVNVTDCINAFDRNNSEFEMFENGNIGNIKKFSFFQNRFSESSIFKIPETAKVEVYCYSGVKDSIDEFYSAYSNQTEITGLEFEKIFEA